MALRIAFAGFRHFHIVDVYDAAGRRDDLELVAACEDHAETRARLAADGKIDITHDSSDELFGWGEFDILAVGDYYARRGELLIRALEAGKHVIVDKPMCTSLDELARITELSAAAGLSVGCQLNQRDSGNFVALRDICLGGRIGEVHTIDFQGQHPLMWGTRPGWYFEEGKHGGTINDIAIHAIDYIPWATGRRIVEVTAARAWNARHREVAFFQDGAQMMLRLDNDGGVLGDVSYLQPDNFAYKVPVYWRMTLHGSEGLAETSSLAEGVTVWATSDDKPRQVPPSAGRPGGYLDDLLAEIGGESLPEGALTTEAVLDAARRTLTIQKAADDGLTRVPLE